MMIKKNGKKKGFTLIELIAVIAIIGILAAVLVPKVLGYVRDARDAKVIAQARNVLMGFETMNSKLDNGFPGTQNPTVAQVITQAAAAAPAGTVWTDYFTVDAQSTDTLNTAKTMTDLKAATDKGNAGAADIKLGSN